MSTERGPLALAEAVASVLSRAGIDAALIGAAALAAHAYPRSTEDIDLAVGIDPSGLDDVAAALMREGFVVEVSKPDICDPLGGVLRISGEGSERVEVVNFLNPPGGGFPALIQAALRDAIPLAEGARLRTVTLPHLVLFKLYAGGAKSKGDVLELLRRHPEVDLDALAADAKRYRLDGRLRAWLRTLREHEDG